MALNSPNFFIIGAAKCGTTTLYSLLRQHPDIFLTEDKEPRFFDSEQYYRKGFEIYLNNHFKNASRYPVRGEATPAYLPAYELAPARIKKDIGEDVKFIVIMRDPVKRAFSHYLHQLRYHVETESFENALKKEHELPEEERPPWTNYFSNGLYARQIKGWLKHYPKEQFFFCLTDDLVANPMALVSKMVDFLGVRSDIALDFKARENVMAATKHKWLARMLNNPNKITNALKLCVPYLVRQRLRDKLNSWNKAAFSRPPALDADIAKELRRKYLDDIEELEQIVQRDLSSWKR